LNLLDQTSKNNSYKYKIQFINDQQNHLNNQMKNSLSLESWLGYIFLKIKICLYNEKIIITLLIQDFNFYILK
jgi:hypothetical protein